MTVVVEAVRSHVVTEPNILTRAQVGELIGLTARTIDEYRFRYRNTETPFPEPDGYFGRSPYWFASRAGDIRKWAASRPGSGRRPRT